MHFLTSLLVLTILVAPGHFQYDRNVFKTCNNVAFCRELRTRGPLNKYEVHPESFVIDPTGHVSFRMEPINDDQEHLLVNISRLVGDTFRLQVKEIGADRYELQDVLVGEPEKAPIDDLASGDGFHTIHAGDYTIRVVYYPLRIEFLRNGETQLYFDGNYFNFEKQLDQAFSFDITFPKASQLYGIHEHADTLWLQSSDDTHHEPYRLRNLDVAGYELNLPMALFGAVPVMYAHGPNSTTGFFLHNAAEQWYDIINRWTETYTYAMVESGSLDLFIFMGPTPTDVVRQYVKLTGTAHLPQLWTLGYHQSRWNYDSQDDITDVVTRFNSNNFPLDGMWLDIDHTNGNRYFTWNPNTFSNPVAMQQNISSTNKRLVTVTAPHIKVERGYSVYDGASNQDLFLKRPNGNNYEGDCWPGLSSYLDFLNPGAQEYYASLFSYDNFPSSTPVLAGIWTDMNEPSVFDNSLEKTLPSDLVHYGGVLHRDVHNIYGLLHTKSTYQGLLARDPNTRPFVLTRSHFAGSQRYAAIWTGENKAHWGYLRISISECLSANLLGIVFCGADVAGFALNPTEELLQRWYQAGAWLPFFRAHSDAGTRRREPYLFSDEVQEVLRNNLQMRYKHLPVWYTLFYEHTRNGDPLIRPFFYHYPQDTNTFKLEDHFLVGRDILVRAIADAEVTSVRVYFPGGTDENWIAISNSDVFPGSGYVTLPVEIEEIPLFYRRGSVIVRKETERLSTDEMVNDGYTLYVNLDANNRATGTIYIDDNTSFNYRDNNEYNYLRIDVVGTDVTLTKIDDGANSAAFDFVIDDVVVNSVVRNPQNGEPGQYEKRVYQTDNSGTPLRSLRVGTAKSVTIKLA